MDSTELHYLTYDPDEIWLEMITAYVDAGGDILYPGDEKEMLLRSVQSDIVQVFAAVDNALRMGTLRYAVSDYLDLIGESRGCERIAAQAATATVSIRTNATGIAGTISAGTAMTADGIVYYTTDEDLTLSGAEETLTAKITADRTGTVGNGLTAGLTMTMSTNNSAVAAITVTESASGGKDAETDDAYRERIREYGLASVTTGTAGRYEAVAKEVSTQIVDAKAINIGSGQVGVYLILSEQTGAETLLGQVLSAVSSDDVKPLTDSVTVAQATDITYDIYADYWCDGTQATVSAIQEAAEEYKDWQNNKIGRAFNPDRLFAMLYQAGATRVKLSDDVTPARPIEYTEIENDERCLASVHLYIQQG